MDKMFRVRLNINEVVRAKTEEQAIDEFTQDGYKYDVEEIKADIDLNPARTSVCENAKYVIVEFPCSQEFMGKEGVYFISGNNAPHSSYAVPVNMYEEWLNKENN